MTIQDAIDRYKANFDQYWADEKYKWIAVQHFQQHWNIDADDFSAMLKEAFSRADNLLGGGKYYPKRMLYELVAWSPERMRELFRLLYNEELPLSERLQPFRSGCDQILKEYRETVPDKEKAKNHYQDLRALMVYLSFAFPDKYYLYKSQMYKSFKEQINYQEKSKEKNSEIRKYDNFRQMCDEVRRAIIEDGELLDMQRKHLASEPDCYSDGAYHLLTQTIIYVTKEVNPDDLHSNAKYKRWFSPIVDVLCSLGGEAPRPAVHDKIYNMFHVSKEELEKKNKSGIPIITNEIDFARNYLRVEGIIDGDAPSGMWKLSELGKRIVISDELAGKIIIKTNIINEAKKNGDPIPSIDLTPYYEYLDIAEDGWFPPVSQYTPGFSKEQWLDILKNPNVIGPVWGGALAAFYEAGGAATCKQIATRYHLPPSAIIGRCTQLANRIYRETNCPLFSEGGRTRVWTILFQGKNADSDTPGSYIWKLRPELYEALTEFGILRFLWNSEDEGLELVEEEDAASYTEEDFLRDVYLSEGQFKELSALLRHKKNIILQGAPGVGKTFAARRLAYTMIGKQSEEQIALVQFHQNYSYEDFVIGYKPVKDGFALQKGVFYQFCEKAAANPDKDFFFLIDEINRGNLSKIFGELLMLLEKDYRGTEITLAYNGEQFTVPKNLYLIGMMNTADRSLAMIDYALRRRFSFFEMVPGFDSDGFRSYQAGLHSDRLDTLIQKIKELNRRITHDKSLGKGFCIGHSYFCGCDNCTDDWLRSVVEYDILPTLCEYWFDDPSELEKWKEILRSVF